MHSLRLGVTGNESPPETLEPSQRTSATDFLVLRTEQGLPAGSFHAGEGVQEQDGRWRVKEVEASVPSEDGLVVVTAGTGYLDLGRKHYLLEDGVLIEREDGLRVGASRATHSEVEGYDLFEEDVWFSKGAYSGWTPRMEYRGELDLLNLDFRVGLILATESTTIATFSGWAGFQGSENRAALANDVLITAPNLELRGDLLETHVIDSVPQDAVLRPKAGRYLQGLLLKPSECEEEPAELRFFTAPVIFGAFNESGDIESVHTHQAGHSTLINARTWEDEPIWDLATQGILAVLHPGELRIQRLEMDGYTAIKRWPKHDGDPALEVTSVKMELSFRDRSGALDEARLIGNVQVKQGSMQLSGELGVYRDAALIMTGKPRLQEPGMVLLARSITVTEGSSVSASERVSCEIYGQHLAVVGSGNKNSPMLITSDEMYTEEGGKWVVFRGRARASRGESLLTAKEIRIARPSGGLKALGAASLVAMQPNGERLVSKAESLYFTGRVAELDDKVLLSSGGLELRSEHARIEFMEDGQTAEEVRAWGAKVVTHRDGHVVVSERVLYRPEEGRAVFSSSNRFTQMTDPQGHIYQGDTLTMQRGSDTMFIGSSDDTSVARAVLLKQE